MSDQQVEYRGARWQAVSELTAWEKYVKSKIQPMISELLVCGTPIAVRGAIPMKVSRSADISLP
jgi:hypothetical protein